MATPPPAHLMDQDAGRSGDAAGPALVVGAGDGWPVDPDGTGTPRSRSPSTLRRTRLKLAVASIPLMLAAVLGVVNAVGGPGEPEAEATAAGRNASAPDAAVAAVQDHTPLVPPWGDAPPAPTGTTADDAGPGSGGSVVESPGNSGDTEDLEIPAVPPGHRAVAVRFAAPDAVDLVEAGDHIDVVGLDGSVLAANVSVLQDRSTAQATVLVLAVPGERAPDLAAAAVTQDLTLLPAPEVP